MTGPGLAPSFSGIAWASKTVEELRGALEFRGRAWIQRLWLGRRGWDSGLRLVYAKAPGEILEMPLKGCSCALAKLINLKLRLNDGF